MVKNDFQWRMELLHPAMWHVVLGWHAMEFAQTSATFEFSIWFRFWPSPQSTYHSAPVCDIFIQIGPLSAEKRTSCRFSRWRILAVLDFMGPIIGSLKSPCTTSCRSSIETIALNCLVFEKIVFFAFWRQTERQTDRLTNRWTQHRCTKPLNKSWYENRMWTSHCTLVQIDGVVLFRPVVCAGEWPEAIDLTGGTCQGAIDLPETDDYQMFVLPHPTPSWRRATHN